MVEWNRPGSDWAPYISWLPDMGELENLPHNWNSEKVELRQLLGLDEQILDDTERIQADWEQAKKFVKKNLKCFENVESADELEPLFYHCALLMMSYSFTDPESENEDSDESFTEEKSQEKMEPIRFMLPVGDLLNHTMDNNAHIEFE